MTVSLIDTDAILLNLYPDKTNRFNEYLIINLK